MFEKRPSPRKMMPMAGSIEKAAASPKHVCIMKQRVAGEASAAPVA